MTMAAPSGLSNFHLGDCLGKGASGQVYRALNWTTGETVAVKQIQLSNIPKAELAEIMCEIDLLKNLHHPNIVQYKGFVKTRDCLYIILEYCENGSLHNFSKKFGKFPENLVAGYISQVLEGLVYLHEQGVIHRDIKGANILTNKDGKVKLADFGVATMGGTISDSAVVGSPYWIAPEVIEQQGATTASDIWSVGSVVIELLDGKPPYYHLSPMPAMFRIVQDDCPPIPEGASAIVRDFLTQCFQKDPNLRISAKKLLKHPWMTSARKNMGTERGTERKVSGYDEAVLKVQEWNEALKSPPRNIVPTNRRSSRASEKDRPASPTPVNGRRLASIVSRSTESLNGFISGSPGQVSGMEKMREVPALQLPEEQSDNWDDDFAEDISPTKLQALDKDKQLLEVEKANVLDEDSATIKPNRSPPGPPQDTVKMKAPPKTLGPIVEDYSDLIGDEDDFELVSKVAKLKLDAGKGKLIRPDDINTVGLGSSAAPASRSAKQTRPAASPVSPSFASLSPSHARSMSYNGSNGAKYSGSLGRTTGLRPEAKEELQRFTESDVEDYDDVFGRPTAASASEDTLRLNTRLSGRSWLGDQGSDEEDPFAEIDEDFDDHDLESNLVRDKYARLCTQVNSLIDDLVPNAPDDKLRNACDQLLSCIEETPELQVQLVSAHGMLAILEVLEANPSRDVTRRLLHLVNTLVTADLAVLESFCLIGGIPVVMSFTSKKFSSECRDEASQFVRLLCNASVMTLQMFISCRGLKVLVDILDEDFADQQELVAHALDGIRSVFELQTPTPRNDFCRMFIREGLLDPLTSALLNLISAEGDPAMEMKDKIIHIILIFCQASQSDTHVRKALGTRSLIRRLLRASEQLDPGRTVVIVKAIKHLSMNSTILDVMQNANTIEVLINALNRHNSGEHSTEIVNHVFQTCYNLCRLNKSRQEEAAAAGIIPHLKRVADSASPLKQFALPILCDLASAGKSCRKLLWQSAGLQTYLRLLADPYFQVSALEAILSWLQDETARVEDVLTQPKSLESLQCCFVTAKANSFENLLDPFLKICRLSSGVALGLSQGLLFQRLLDKLSYGKAVVRLGLLRILRVLCDANPDRPGLVERYKIYDAVEKLSKQDGAVLVRELAREIIPSLRPGPPPPPLKEDVPRRGLAPKRQPIRRSASEISFGTPELLSSVSQTPLLPPATLSDATPLTPKPRARKPLIRPQLSWRTTSQE